MSKKKLNPNAVKTRDYLTVALINGATKAGVHKDLKRDASRKACRKKVRFDERRTRLLAARSAQ